ncbi:MAG TPA: peptidoglycan-binding protein [Gaiellaceae bacterium]|nr:peptidoglycan-binding protein [Gaiellaceae bacterium]
MLTAAAVVAAVLAPSANAVGGNSVNPQIAGLQVALRAWGYYNGPVDGIAGPVTAGGLHAFQRRMHLPTGTANAQTRAKLGPLGKPLFGSRLLERGCFGWDVSVLQFVLWRAGLYNGALDGYLDGTTERALKKFQARARLAADGVAGRATLAAIATHARVPVRPHVVQVAQLVYVVKSGDSLTAIAHRFGTSVRALASSNHVDPSRYLIIGTRLRVPHAAPTDVRALLDKWAAHFGVDASLVRALAWMESGYQTKLVSSAGARGVMQLLPTTRQYAADVLVGQPIPAGVDGDVEAGVAYIKHLLDVFHGNTSLALAGWYQGERAVRTSGVYKVSKPFVADVLALRARM